MLVLGLDDLTTGKVVVRTYKVNESNGALTQLASATAPAVENLSFLAVSPDGRSAYVLNEAGTTDHIWGFSIAQSGTLGLIDSIPRDVANNGVAMAMTPNGSAVHVVNTATSNNWQVFVRTASTGALSTPLNLSESGGVALGGIVFAPDGTHAYVIRQGATDSLSSHALSANGSPNATGNPNPNNSSSLNPQMDVLPNGTQVLVSETGQDVVPFMADGSGLTGVVGSATAGMGNNGGQVRVSPDGDNFYVTVTTADTVRGFKIIPDGLQTPPAVGGSPVSMTCPNILGLAITTSGRWLYTLCPGSLQMARVERDTSTGALLGGGILTSPDFNAENLQPIALAIATVAQ
jgi:hypothetical protein